MESAPVASFKRVLDVALSGVVLVAAAPVMLALAVAVKLDSPGPALFFQTRVGRGRRPIRVAKLRTMVVNAERVGLTVTAARDPRVTRVGALLRKTKLDELPQLWNVLRGDMSIVGPRPEVAHFVERYRPEWEPLLRVRPGLTDLASLAFRDEERLLATATDRERAYAEIVMPLKLKLALEGLQRDSVLDDLFVIVHTAWAVLRAGDAPPHPVVREAHRRIELLNTMRDV